MGSLEPLGGVTGANAAASGKRAGRRGGGAGRLVDSSRAEPAGLRPRKDDDMVC